MKNSLSNKKLTFLILILSIILIAIGALYADNKEEVSFLDDIPAATQTAAATVSASQSDKIYSDLYLSNYNKKSMALTGFVCADQSFVGMQPDFRIYYGRRAGKIRGVYEIPRKDLQFYKYLNQNCAGKRIFVISQLISSRKARKIKMITLFTPKKVNYKLDYDKVTTTRQKFGIIYSTRQCVVSEKLGAKIYDIEKILQGKEKWGPILWRHWRSEPIDGYYCLSDNPELLKKHAFLLSAMGINFIVVDMTNNVKVYNGSRYTDDFNVNIHRPLSSLTSVWNDLQKSGVPVPKIVPWIGVTTKYKNEEVRYTDSIARYVNTTFKKMAKRLMFGISRKPLILVKMNKGVFAPDVVNNAIKKFKLNRRFDIRPMWAFRETFLKNNPDANINMNKFWTFMDSCNKRSDGAIANPCNQPASMEEISVSVAYQDGIMMSLSDKTNRRKGRTLYQQFIKVLNDQGKTPFVVLNGWNEWTGPRGCPIEKGQNYSGNAPITVPFGKYQYYENLICPKGEFYDNGRPAFMDTYSNEYSRVIEPEREFGDCYYQLARTLILATRTGKKDLTLNEKNSFNVCSFNLIK